MLPNNRPTKLVPGKRLRNWHRAYNARAAERTERMTLKAYARMIASGGGRLGAVAEAWRGSK